MTRKRMKRKTAALLTVLMIMAIATAGLTLAMLVDKTEDVENAFTPSEVTCEIAEQNWIDGVSQRKENVQVKNTGDTDAFIRATVVVTWQKTEEGKVLVASEVPIEETDYTIVWYDDDSWFKYGGYYYFKNRVAAENLTSVLIKSFTVNSKHPEGYRLSVEIIADAIQADGFKAGAAENEDQPAEIAWGVVVNNEGGKAVSIAPPTAVVQ